MTSSIGLRPNRSAGAPATSEPMTVPISAEATVKPRLASESAKRACNAVVVPDITAVSNPNSSPPSAAPSALSTIAPVTRPSEPAASPASAMLPALIARRSSLR